MPKTCYFHLDGPHFQAMVQIGNLQPWKARTLMESDHFATYYKNKYPSEIIELARVTFKAKMRFHAFHAEDKRVMVMDVYGRLWSVYQTEMNTLIPAMNKGVLDAWWSITKKGSMYGLTVDVQRPLGPVTPDKDVPMLLANAKDLSDVVPFFHAMAV